MEQDTNYDQQGLDFIKSHGIKFSTLWLDHNTFFEGDKERRDIWNVTLKRNGKQFSVRFGQSIANTGESPSPYELLSCITKHDPGTFHDFCGCFGYDEDSRKAEKIYKGVCKEWAKVKKFFTPEELNELQEIN